MKRTLTEEARRIMEIMGKTNLTELNVQYMDQLLDKISASGMESLSRPERDALQQLSTDQDDVEPPRRKPTGIKYRNGSWGTTGTLRFTTTDQNTGEPLVRPEDAGETFGEAVLENAYIHGEAADLAGYELPVFIDGDLSQLDKPVEEQSILMLTDEGEWECEAHVDEEDGREVYYLTLKPFEEDDDDEFAGLNEDMSQYDINTLPINEGNAFVGAAKKAREAGKDSFELNGKSYKVTVKSTEPTEEEGFASDTDALEDSMGDIPTQ